MDAASNAQIGAEKVQQTLFQGANVTGSNQTICVVDTGIDYTHESLGSCAGYYRSLPDNETILYTANDTLLVSTGQQSFITGPTDTQTLDQSFVRFSSGRVNAFSFEREELIAYNDDFMLSSITVEKTTDFYVVTDNRSSGNSTQGLVMYRSPTTGLFVPFFDYQSSGSATFGTPLNSMEIIWTRNIFVYPQNVTGCVMPAPGTPLYQSGLSHARLTPTENFTITNGRPVAYGYQLFNRFFQGNLTVLASGLNASCSGNAVLQFNGWNGLIRPGLGLPSVRYSVENNYVPYHTGRGVRKIRLYAPGISLGAQDPQGVHSLWIPEPSVNESGTESAWSLDVGYADSSTPHLAPVNGTPAAGYSAAYTPERLLPLETIQPGFVSPQKSALTQLALASATLIYTDASNASLVESGHPYGDHDDLRYVIHRPGFSSISLHFVNLSVEAIFDKVFIEHPNGTIVANYSGTRRNFWTPPVPGDTAVVHLKADVFGNSYGFAIDQVSNSTQSPTERWTCPRVLAAADFISGSEGLDDNGHGTHVAGIAAGSGIITGVAPTASLLAAKSLDAWGAGYSSSIIAGIDWCVANKNAYNVSTLTMSLGSYETTPSACDSDPMAQAIQRAADAGIFVSVASGNSYNASGVSYPACSSYALAVGAVNSADSVASFSNAWNRSLVLAPGVDVLSAFLNQQTKRFNGTSMAAPHVAGLAALLQDFSTRANGSRVSPAYLRQTLQRTGISVRDARNDLYYPRVDAWAAFQRLKADYSPRNLTLTSFANGSLVADSFVNVNVSFFDDGPLSSCIFEWNNGTRTNQSMTVGNTTCSTVLAGQSDSNGTGSVQFTDTYGNTANLSFQLRFAPSFSTVRLNVANGTATSNASLALSGTFFIPDARTCILSVDGANQSANASACQFNTTLSEGWHAIQLFVQDASNATGASPRTYVLADRTAPTAPIVTALANRSGFIHLNWTPATDAFGLSGYDVYRNGTALLRLSANQTQYDDRTTASGTTYAYHVAALDLPANTNTSRNATTTANDSVAPQPVTNLTASNQPDGSINLSWTAVTHDAAGEPEASVTYSVYRSANASVPVLSSLLGTFFASAVSANATLLGTTLQTYFIDHSTLSPNTTYSYAVLATDANANVNATASANSTLNQTTSATCTSNFSDFSSCSGGSQSRSRTCFGIVQTETQACLSGGSSGGSSGSSSTGSSGSTSSSPSTTATTSTSSGPRGSSGAGGSGNQLFPIETLPGVLDFTRGTPASTQFTVSSYYTGYLRYLNFTLAGIPRDWYEVLGPTVVTPLGKTDFWISWRIPESTQGRYPVTLELSGVGTKNAGTLRTNYSFQLVLTTPSSTAQLQTAPTTGTTAVPAFAPLQPVESTSRSNAGPLSGAVTAASIQISDGLFYLFVLGMIIGGYLWVHSGRRSQ